MATPPEGKAKVTVNLDERLVHQAKLEALKRSRLGKRTTLQDLIEAGLRKELK